MHVETLIADAGNILERAGIENGRQEARWLMSQLLNDLAPGRFPCVSGELPEDILKEFNAWVERRVAGEPLQYIMGSAEFYNVELLVGPGVLVPRPETEQLVELALQMYHGGRICDVCTGSGAIALALAKELPATLVTGLDISEEALAFAEANRARLGSANVTFLKGDLFSPLKAGEQFGLITANPPYISRQDYDELDATVRDYEPQLALLSGDDGLDALRGIAKTIGPFMAPGAVFISEIGEEQGERARALFSDVGAAEIRQDYAGKDRFLIVKRVK